MNRGSSLNQILFRIHRLASRDGYHLIDVVNRAAAAEVVDRLSDTLEDRTDSVSSAKSLNELVCDVSDLKAWEHEDIRMAGDL